MKAATLRMCLSALVPALCWWLACGGVAAGELPELSAATGQPLAGRDVASQVQPIDWPRFAKRQNYDAGLDASRKLLLNAARYNLSWMEKTFELNETGDAYQLAGNQEHDVRPACSVAYGMAVVLQTGIYDPEFVQVDEREARVRTLRLLRGVVRAHAANSDYAKAWGPAELATLPETYWQTALWASLSGMGGWLLWDELDSKTQDQITCILQRERRRFFSPNYRVPYWNGVGGDTKAEENSWNSMLMSLSVAMLPRHPDVDSWKQRGSELLISSYATQADWQSSERHVDGRGVTDWLEGYNALKGGVVVNHDITHPDYMAAVSMNFWALTTQSLAGASAPEAWDFNAELIYRTFASKRWESPPYEAPGGPMYVLGNARVYYPSGTDWSRCDLSPYYLMDVYAERFRWHKQASEWKTLRAEAMLSMQSRHADGHMFAPGEYDTYAGAEQWIFWCLADALLPQWLSRKGELSSSSNWLAK